MASSPCGIGPGQSVIHTAVDGARESENGSPFVFHHERSGALVGVGSINAGCPDVVDGLPPPPRRPTGRERCGNDAQIAAVYQRWYSTVFSSAEPWRLLLQPGI